jgi:hypothetical protein
VCLLLVCFWFAFGLLLVCFWFAFGLLSVCFWFAFGLSFGLILAATNKNPNQNQTH